MGRDHNKRMWVNLIDEVCFHCGSSVSLANYRRHVEVCQTRTPAQRTAWAATNRQRQQARRKKREAKRDGE